MTKNQTARLHVKFIYSFSSFRSRQWPFSTNNSLVYLVRDHPFNLKGVGVGLWFLGKEISVSDKDRKKQYQNESTLIYALKNIIEINKKCHNNLSRQKNSAVPRIEKIFRLLKKPQLRTREIIHTFTVFRRVTF